MTLTIGPTIIGGEKLTDDYTVKEDGYGCGRIRLSMGPNARHFWHWVINPPVPIKGNRDGQTNTLEQAQEQWKAAWASARPSLTDHDVQHWHQIADAARKSPLTT